MFLDFIPASHQYLLTVLSIWWAIGQLLGSLIAWPLIANFSCASAENCTRGDAEGAEAVQDDAAEGARADGRVWARARAGGGSVQ